MPSNIKISHKFGEVVFTNDDSSKSTELHDCGIVYYPKHPYFLCIMTHGDNFDKLESTIKDISGAVYSEVQKMYR